jgi:hypothetical protein
MLLPNSPSASDLLYPVSKAFQDVVRFILSIVLNIFYQLQVRNYGSVCKKFKSTAEVNNKLRVNVKLSLSLINSAPHHKNYGGVKV